MSDEEEKPEEVPFGVAASVVKASFEKTTSIRVSVEDIVAMGIEVRQLRAQVDELQAIGTAQLSASRAACWETAATLCDQIWKRYMDNGFRDTEVVASTLDAALTGAIAAEECAMAIRELAKR